jgi:hypothetical protein
MIPELDQHVLQLKLRNLHLLYSNVQQLKLRNSHLLYSNVQQLKLWNSPVELLVFSLHARAIL